LGERLRFFRDGTGGTQIYNSEPKETRSTKSRKVKSLRRKRGDAGRGGSRKSPEVVESIGLEKMEMANKPTHSGKVSGGKIKEKGRRWNDNFVEIHLTEKVQAISTYW